MHPSHAIRGRKSQLLEGRRVVVGISGSIAAIEAPRVIRELIRHGATVRAVMSSEAARIVTAEAVEFATGSKPVLQLSGSVEHVSWLGPGSDRADLYLVAPATANTISKIAQGIDDTPVTSFASVALGGGIPLLLAPAMHGDMAANPAIRENVERLRRWGVIFVEPHRAEGEEKIAFPDEVAAAVLHRMGRAPWLHRRVVVVGGASREPIDSVRSVSNESSGATAVALATQAFYRGGEVTFWAGPMTVPVPPFLSPTPWRSVADLVKLVGRNGPTLRRSEVILVPAAVSDYTIEAQPGKISSRDHAELTLKLKRAPKLLPLLRRATGPKGYLVGFKLEAGLTPADLEASARRLMEDADLDAVVANDHAVMAEPVTSLIVVTRSGRRFRLHGPKEAVAGKLLDDLSPELVARDTDSARRRAPG